MKKILILILPLLLYSFSSMAQRPKEFYNWPSLKGDSFYVNNVLFKICILDTMSRKAFIEKFQNKKWNILDSFDIQDYGRSVDVDRNGFPDIAIWWKLSYDVFLFDPFKNTFIHSGEFSTVDLNDSFYYKVDAYTGKSFEEQKMQIINKDMNLYYDYVPEKRGEFHSSLFQLIDFKKIVLGTIYQYAHFDKSSNNYTPDETEIRKYLQQPIVHPIMKGENGVSYQEVPTREITVDDIKSSGIHGFDYATYWKNNWQNFLKK